MASSKWMTSVLPAGKVSAATALAVSFTGAPLSAGKCGLGTLSGSGWPLAGVAALEPKIGAFVNLNLEGARAAADQSTARWRAGRPRSKIDGMPIGIKDIIETADMPTENGSPLFAGFRSERDGASVAALREAGAVIVGKTVTTEFASTEPRGTRNPHDLRRTPGGSSSGSAAGVASGMVSTALGAQAIRSTNRPASYFGCNGLQAYVAPAHPCCSSSSFGP